MSVINIRSLYDTRKPALKCVLNHSLYLTADVAINQIGHVGQVKMVKKNKSRYWIRRYSWLQDRDLSSHQGRYGKQL